MDNNKRIYAKTGYYALCFLACSQILAICTILIFSLLFHEVLSDSIIIAIASVAQYLGALPFCIIVLKGLPKQLFSKRNLNLSELFGIFCICSLFSEIGYFLGSLCADVLSNIVGTNVNDILNEQINFLGAFENFFVLVLAAPILEELIFRKILLDKTAVNNNKYTAVYLSALIFGLIHCNIYQFFYAFFIGVILGVLYIKSGKIIYCMIIHASFNLIFGFIPSVINTETQIGSALIISYAILQCAFIFYGISCFFRYMKKHKSFCQSFLCEINANFGTVMLNHGVFISVIITTVLYIIGLF